MAKRVLRRGSLRRKLVWARRQASIGIVTAVALALAAPTRVDVLSEFVTAYGAALVGSTVVRVRGYMIGSQAAQAAVANVTACMYIGDANDVVRGPNANDNYYDSNSRFKDYFLVEPLFCPNTAAAVQPIQGSDVSSRLIDVRAMRKLEEVSQRLIMDVSGFSAAVSTQPFVADLSILIMLP